MQRTDRHDQPLNVAAPLRIGRKPPSLPPMEVHGVEPYIWDEFEHFANAMRQHYD